MSRGEDVAEKARSLKQAYAESKALGVAKEWAASLRPVRRLNGDLISDETARRSSGGISTGVRCSLRSDC